MCSGLYAVHPIPGLLQMQAAGGGVAMEESKPLPSSAVMCSRNYEVAIEISSTSRGVNTGTTDHSPLHWWIHVHVHVYLCLC